MANRKDRSGGGDAAPKPDRLNEARLEYVVGEAEPGWMPLGRSRISAKNQITLPVAMTRALGWQPSDEVSLMVYDDTIVLHRLPRTTEEWGTWLSGSISLPEWSTKEKIDAWIRNEHDSWDREWDQD